MKLKLAVILAAFFAFAVSSVQAIDTGMPDILSSVSSGLVKTLSKDESAEVRGEYRYCTRGFPRYCGTTFSRSEPFGNQYINIVWKYRVPGFSVWVSR